MCVARSRSTATTVAPTATGPRRRRTAGVEISYASRTHDSSSAHWRSDPNYSRAHLATGPRPFLDGWYFFSRPPERCVVLCRTTLLGPLITPTRPPPLTGQPFGLVSTDWNVAATALLPPPHTRKQHLRTTVNRSTFPLLHRIPSMGASTLPSRLL